MSSKRVYVMDCGDFIKIGVSANVDKRKEQIQYDVKQYYCTEPVENPFEIEKSMHSIFSAVRADNAEGKEYFSIQFDTAVEVLKAIASATKEQVNSLVKSIDGIREIKCPNQFYKAAAKTMFMKEEDLIFTMCVAEGLVARSIIRENKVNYQS